MLREAMTMEFENRTFGTVGPNIHTNVKPSLKTI
jgi:hypothetical protein